MTAARESEQPTHVSAERKRWAYRLVVEIPDECLEPGFVPDVLLEKETWRDWDEQPFRWPRRRVYFDWSAASRRAYMLATWGATVTIERAPVEGWEPNSIYRPGAMPESLVAS